jgi:dihydroflavonol-4-reductase
MKILVTGATGFIGFHIVEELAKQGLGLKAAYRPGDKFHFDSDFLIDGLDLESFPLDLTDRHAVHRALEDCQVLFHAEYFFSYKRRDKARMIAINQIGTRNVMEAALAQGVEKVVYTSGMETLMVPPDQEVATESDGVSLQDLSTPFEKSRFLAEREATHFRQKGLPLVIVHPTVCLGTRDREPSPFGRYLRRYLTRKTHYFLDTGLNLVDVNDVAKGHLLAAKRGEVGARYILGNQNVYLLDILQHLEKFTQIRAPKTALPPTIAKLGNALVRGIFRRRGGIPNAVIRRLERPFFFDPSLARNDLGMPQSNIWQALQREIIDQQKML